MTSHLTAVREALEHYVSATKEDSWYENGQREYKTIDNGGAARDGLKHLAALEALSAPPAVMECLCKQEKINIGGQLFPFAFMAPYDPQARKNHSQTMRRLMERGGLGWSEAANIIMGKDWSNPIAEVSAREIVIKEYYKWRLPTPPIASDAGSDMPTMDQITAGIAAEKFNASDAEVTDEEITRVLQDGYNSIHDMGEALDLLREKFTVTIGRK